MSTLFGNKGVYLTFAEDTWISEIFSSILPFGKHCCYVYCENELSKSQIYSFNN